MEKLADVTFVAKLHKANKYGNLGLTIPVSLSKRLISGESWVISMKKVSILVETGSIS